MSATPDFVRGLMVGVLLTLACFVFGCALGILLGVL